MARSGKDRKERRRARKSRAEVGKASRMDWWGIGAEQSYSQRRANAILVAKSIQWISEARKNERD